ncbi:MAG: DUF6883 domain-containing protein [Chromatiales bacterium]
MRLPSGEKAIVDSVKLRDYCLSMNHPEGRHKARVFMSALGLTAEQAHELEAALLSAARDGEANVTDRDQYGQRYAVDFRMERGEREATIRSSWIIRRGEKYPRLTSCYVL